MSSSLIICIPDILFLLRIILNLVYNGVYPLLKEQCALIPDSLTGNHTLDKWLGIRELESKTFALGDL